MDHMRTCRVRMQVHTVSIPSNAAVLKNDVFQDVVRNKELLSVPNNLRPNLAILDWTKLADQTRGRILWGCPEDFHSVILSKRSNEVFPQAAIQALNLSILWTLWKHEAICHRDSFHHLQHIPIPNHALWFTWNYQSFLPLLRKLGRLIHAKLSTHKTISAPN